MNKNIILMIILALLIVASTVQAFQLASLKSKIDAGAVKIGQSGAKAPAGISSSGSGSTAAELPSMVGGC